MPSSRKISRKCIFFLAMSVLLTMLILPAEIFEYHGYLRHIMSKDPANISPEFHWSLGQDISKNSKNKEIQEKKEKIDRKSNRIKHVIILAYMRSGSSLTGKLLEQSDNSIYFFEPLRPLEWSYSKKIPLTDFNNKTRMGGSKVEDDKLRIKILEDLFACQFRSTYKDIFFDRSRSSDDRFRPFYNCIGKEIHKVDRCLHLIQDICDRSLVRIAKVIRMRGNTIFKMMENHPDLKVIHLLRDPRAILNSLREMRLSFVMEKKAEYLCDYMKSNSIEFDSIFKLYPNQAATIFYESLAKDPIDMTKKLYDFIGIKTTDNVLAWIKENMLGKQLNNETYTVRNRNALSVSNKWRNQLKIEDINTIDAICKDFYDMSGYAEVGDLEELKDSKIFHFRDDSKLIASDLKHMNEDAISLNGKRSLK